MQRKNKDKTFYPQPNHNMLNKFQQGQLAEDLVAKYYQAQNYKIIIQNYNIRWWELDIVAENETQRIFIEVKLVNRTQHLHDYVTPSKLKALFRTIQNFQHNYSTSKSIRLDVAFVRWNDILNVHENVTNN